MSNHTFDTQSDDFIRGMNDGYCGYSASELHEGNANYDAGYAAGEHQWADDQDAERERSEAADYDYVQEAELDFYDYEPSPYDGTYSEM